jgi:hypothetical protein
VYVFSLFLIQYFFSEIFFEKILKNELFFPQNGVGIR